MLAYGAVVATCTRLSIFVPEPIEVKTTITERSIVVLAFLYLPHSFLALPLLIGGSFHTHWHSEQNQSHQLLAQAPACMIHLAYLYAIVERYTRIKIVLSLLSIRLHVRVYLHPFTEYCTSLDNSSSTYITRRGEPPRASTSCSVHPTSHLLQFIATKFCISRANDT